MDVIEMGDCLKKYFILPKFYVYNKKRLLGGEK